MMAAPYLLVWPGSKQKREIVHTQVVDELGNAETVVQQHNITSRLAVVRISRSIGRVSFRPLHCHPATER